MVQKARKQGSNISACVGYYVICVLIIAFSLIVRPLWSYRKREWSYRKREWSYRKREWSYIGRGSDHI